MRAREIADESRRAGSRVIMSFAFSAAGLMLLLSTWRLFTPDRTSAIIVVLFGVLFAGGLLAAIVNAIIFVRIGGLKTDPPPSGITRMESNQRITDSRLENHNDASASLGKMDLSRNEWRKLATTLAHANWKWSRRRLASTHVWESLTIGDRYNIVTTDFERLQAVAVDRFPDGKIKGVRVTPFGREEICRLAGTPLL